MLPVCSAAPCCSSHSKIFFHVGSRAFCPSRKITEHKLIVKHRSLFCTQDEVCSQDIKMYATKCMHSIVVERPDQSGSLDSSIFSPYRNEFDDIVRGFSNDYSDTDPESWSFSTREINKLYPIGEDIQCAERSRTCGPQVLHNDFRSDVNASNIWVMVETPDTAAYREMKTAAALPTGNEFSNLHDTLSLNSTALSESASGSSSASNAKTGPIFDGSVPISDAFEVGNKGLSNLKESFEQLLSGIIGSVSTSINRAEGAAKSTYNAFTLTVSDTLESVTETFDGVVRALFSSLDSTNEQTGRQLSGLSSNTHENMYGAGTLAIDILRHAIVTLEDSLANVATLVVHFYGSAKSLLPLNIRELFNLSESKVAEILRPVGAAFQQVNINIEGFEKTLGLDPNDPLVSFLFLIGCSATIGTSFWLFNYGGYSGDLAPEITLELLKNEKNAVLIDVRPEGLRKRDGIPDLRRGARSKYASIALPEIDGSVRKLLQTGKKIEDALISVVIRNLKIVQDGSVVIVMDDSGGRSKAIAKSLKKLGVKKPYLVQGGFRSWVKNGLRIKELKPETTLTILNEEAEAIIEDIKPTPALVIGYGLGISSAVYALLEWEKTLQIIGLIGLGQTLYQRVASYKDSEDLKQDVRLLLAPVKQGAQAFSWAARKLEPNKNGLPTSPSSTEVQDRVLQAAAKHESQPSDSEETQGLPRDSTDQAAENANLSEPRL